MGNYSYSNVPILRRKRSRFDLSHGVKTSANVGTLYPFEVQEVYSGDTFKVDTACVSRLSSQFLRPIMDNLFLDVYYFYVPSRLLYDRFKEIFGENKKSAWAQVEDVVVPNIGEGEVYSKSVADYMGLPVGLGGNVSILPFRAFAKIYDEWFRDQNNVSPMHIQTGEQAVSELLNNKEWSPNNYTGMPPKVSKFHDYFTSCLPAPQKGNAVDLPLAVSNDVPVVTSDLDYIPVGSAQRALRFSGYSLPPTPDRPYVALGIDSSKFAINNTSELGYLDGVGSNVPPLGKLYPTNLQALTSQANIGSVSVNDLRFAFQYQKMLERDARGGTRYTEYLQSHFGVTSPDASLQRSEFLGGRRSPLSITQVTQTTGSDSNSAPLAQVGAYSHSMSKSRYVKGFTEHGFVIGVFCIRQFHTYQQGIDRFWKRFKRSEFYDPVFANIGEQPVYKYELYGLGEEANRETPFGYNEAWADLRGRTNKVTGQMRTGVKDSLDIWHLADNYDNAPTLNEQFINETPDYLDRVITVPSTSQDQFILDFYIKNIAYRELPTYSVPSLIDHN